MRDDQAFERKTKRKIALVGNLGSINTVRTDFEHHMISVVHMQKSSVSMKNAPPWESH